MLRLADLRILGGAIWGFTVFFSFVGDLGLFHASYLNRNRAPAPMRFTAVQRFSLFFFLFTFNVKIHGLGHS